MAYVISEGMSFFFRLEFINFGNRTEWSPVRSVIIQVITKSYDCEAGVRFVNHEYDYRQNWTTRGPVTSQLKL